MRKVHHCCCLLFVVCCSLLLPCMDVAAFRPARPPSTPTPAAMGPEIELILIVRGVKAPM